MHPLEEIRQMHGDISKIKDIKDIKIKSLMALGATALVFETEDGNALKLTPYDHFPSKRQPADFDLPCFKKANQVTLIIICRRKSRRMIWHKMSCEVL